MAASYSLSSQTFFPLEATLEGTVPPQSAVARRRSGPGAAPTLLVVDDDPLVLRTLKRVLKATRPGWNITAATGPSAALSLLSEQAFDVLLTDLDMPGMRGEQLLEEALLLDPSLTCVVHSGQIEVLKPAVRAKLTGIIGKPATMTELGEALDHAVAVSKRRSLKAVPLV